MRHLTKLLLTAGLAVAFVSVTLAQPGRGGGFQLTEATLLSTNKSVQEELKLSDAQKEKLTKITEKFLADMKDAAKDKDAAAKVRETRDTAVAEVVKDLKAEQKKRLMQIFVQVNMNTEGGKGVPVGNPLLVFASEDVQKELKLNDDQKTKIKKLVSDTEADVKEIRKGIVKGDKDSQKAATEKIATLNKDAVEKITGEKGILTDDQKKIFKDLPGEKFAIKFETPGGKDKKKDN
jgi:ethanolamine utilization protein EutA (predicted chaperonin)